LQMEKKPPSSLSSTFLGSRTLAIDDFKTPNGLQCCLPTD